MPEYKSPPHYAEFLRMRTELGKSTINHNSLFPTSHAPKLDRFTQQDSKLSVPNKSVPAYEEPPPFSASFLPSDARLPRGVFDQSNNLNLDLDTSKRF